MVDLHSPPPLDWQLLDIGLRDEDLCCPVMYLAVSRFDIDVAWKGATLFESRDSGTTYDAVATITRESVMGKTGHHTGETETGSKLPDKAIGAEDTTSTLRVTLHRFGDATLANSTLTRMQNGFNNIIVGREMGAFRTQSLIEEGVYDISNLLRGLRGTHRWTDEHDSTDDEPFVLLDLDRLVRICFNFEDLDQTFFYKLVPRGGALADYQAFEVSLRGHSMRPYPVVSVTDSRDGSDNVTISWNRLSRTVTYNLNAVPDFNPGCCFSRRYEVDIMDGATVVRTIVVEDEETLYYPAADQTTDGLTPGAGVPVVRIYHMSDALGRGQQVDYTVT